MKDIFPVQKSILCSDGLKKYLLPEYDLSASTNISFYASGLNDTFLFTNVAEKHYFRIYRKDWRTKAEIESEIVLLNHLNKDNISVAYPIKKKNGEFLTEINSAEGKRYAVLFVSAKGKYHFKRNKKRCINYGEIVAKVHKSADNLEKLNRFEIDLNHLLDVPLNYIKPFLNKRIADYEFLENVAKELKLEINSLLDKEKPVYGICHGDFHNGNIFFDKHNNPTLFDFDCFGYGWRAYDIAVNLWSATGFDQWEKKDNSQRTRNWNNFLEGYLKVKSLNDNELKAAYIFAPIRHIWLMGLHTHGSKDWGMNWLNDSYFDRQLKFIKKWIEYFKI